MIIFELIDNNSKMGFIPLTIFKYSYYYCFVIK
jgi:hypothetical protein